MEKPPTGLRVLTSPDDTRLQVRAKIVETIQIVLEEELTAIPGSQCYERTEGRVGDRNGKEPRGVKTETGPLELEVPRARIEAADRSTSEYRSPALPRYPRRTRRADEAILGAYLAGASTRRIKTALAPLLGETNLSKSAISREAQRIKSSFESWSTRSLAEDSYPVVYLDGVLLKVRMVRRVVSVPVLAALGVAEGGTKVLISLRLVGSESSATWKGLIEDRSRRGLPDSRCASTSTCSTIGNGSIRRSGTGRRRKSQRSSPMSKRGAHCFGATPARVLRILLAATLLVAIGVPALAVEVGAPRFWRMVTQATAHSNLVARATITQSTGHYNASSDEVTTECTATLRDIYKGDANEGSTITFWVDGGGADGHWSFASHNAFLPAVGSDWLLFLVKCHDRWGVGYSGVQHRIAGTEACSVWSAETVSLDALVSHVATVIYEQTPNAQYAHADLVCVGTATGTSDAAMTLIVDAVYKSPASRPVAHGASLSVYRDDVIGTLSDNTPWAIANGATVLCFLSEASDGRWRHPGSVYGILEWNGSAFVAQTTYQWCPERPVMAAISSAQIEALAND